MNLLSPQHPFASYILVIKDNKVLNRLAEINLSKGYCWQIRSVGQPFPNSRDLTRIYINELDGLLLTLVRKDYDKVLVPNTLDCVFEDTQVFYRDFVRSITRKPKVSTYNVPLEQLEPATKVTVTSSGLESEELQGFIGETSTGKGKSEEIAQIFNDPMTLEWLQRNKKGIDCYEDVIVPMIEASKKSAQMKTDPVMITPMVSISKGSLFFRAATTDVEDHKEEMSDLSAFVDDGISSAPWSTRSELDDLLGASDSSDSQSHTDSEE